MGEWVFLGIVNRLGVRPFLATCLFTMVLAGLGSGCSKDHPLSEEQKGTMNDLMDSSGRAYTAARRNTGSSFDSQMATQRGPNSALDQMTSLLQQRILQKKCKATLFTPKPLRQKRDDPSFAAAPKVFTSLKVSGNSSCPITMEFRISTQSEESIGRWATSIDYTYQVELPEYRPLNDVDSVIMKGGMSLNGLGTDHVRSEINMTGVIHSQQQGDVPLTMEGTLDGPPDQMSGEVSLRFDFPNFYAEFKETYDNGSIKYSINEEEVSRDDFEGYFNRGGDPFFYGSNPFRLR